MCTEGLRKENKSETFDSIKHAMSVIQCKSDSYFIIKINSSCGDSQGGVQIYDMPTSHSLSPSSSHTNQECVILHGRKLSSEKNDIQI